MMNDVSIQDVPFVPEDLARKLQALEIRSVRQLAARLQSETTALGDYLELGEADLKKLCTATREFVEKHFPAATLRAIYPQVSRRGVAVNRLDDRFRPRFEGD